MHGRGGLETAITGGGDGGGGGVLAVTRHISLAWGCWESSPPLMAGLGCLGFTFPKYAPGMQPAYRSHIILDYQSVPHTIITLLH